jgi:hypothetical protein
MAPSVAHEGTLHCKLDSPLHWAPARSIFWDGGKSIMEIPVESLHTSLVEANIRHVFYESPGTAHEWQTWRRDLKDFAPRLFQEAAR